MYFFDLARFWLLILINLFICIIINDGCILIAYHKFCGCILFYSLKRCLFRNICAIYSFHLCGYGIIIIYNLHISWLGSSFINTLNLLILKIIINFSLSNLTFLSVFVVNFLHLCGLRSSIFFILAIMLQEKFFIGLSKFFIFVVLLVCLTAYIFLVFFINFIWIFCAIHLFLNVYKFTFLQLKIRIFLSLKFFLVKRTLRFLVFLDSDLIGFFEIRIIFN